MHQNKPNIESKTLWIGDLDTWMNESNLSSLITSLGYSVQGIKLVRDKQSNLPPKYGFIQFKLKEHASNFYQSYNGMPIPNYAHKTFKLNWSTYGTTKTSQINSLKPSGDIQVYVGEISLSLTQHKLLAFFKTKYPTAYMCKIITDPLTKVSKGYGFVKFTNQQEANKAILEMNGQMLADKLIKVSHAHQKNKQEIQQQEETQTEAAKRIKMYQHFYSMMNDPLLKAEYQKQALKTFQDGQTKQGTFKQKMENIRSLTYKQTIKSEQFLNHMPKVLAFRSKLQVQSKMYH